MEVQRIYSEVDTDERLYSVLMTEEEVRLFAKSKDDVTAKEAISVGMIPVVSKMTEQDLPSGILQKKFYKKYKSNVEELSKHKENKRLIEELIKDARKQKTAVHFVRDGKGTGSFYYSPEAFDKEVINDYYNVSKKNLKKNKNSILLDDLLFYSKVRKSSDNIVLDTNEASTLAHELGHSKHHGGRDGSKIGKLAHKLRYTKLAQLDKKLVDSAGPTFSHLVRNGAPLSMAAGFASGYDSGKKLAKGEKDSVVNKTAYAALPVIHQAPKLVSEFEASRQGIKLLKKAGASKEFIKQSKKALGNAYGTYAASLATPVALGYLARQAGKVTGKLSESDKKKKKTDK